MRMATHEQRARTKVSGGLEEACDGLCEVAARRGTPLPRATVLSALQELRARGGDRDWLAAFADYLNDKSDRRSDSVRRGLEELARGDLEPA
jgi:hypothetical protein